MRTTRDSTADRVGRPALDPRFDASPPVTPDALVRRFYAPLLNYFRRRTRDPADVEDLVQQVFLRLTQHPVATAAQTADGYVFQIAANILKDHARRRSVRKRLMAPVTENAEIEMALEYSDFSPERVLAGKEAIERVIAAIEELPERTRDVFVLRCLEGLKYAEIARLLGISTRAAEKHLCKALVHVSHALD